MGFGIPTHLGAIMSLSREARERPCFDLCRHLFPSETVKPEISTTEQGYSGETRLRSPYLPTLQGEVLLGPTDERLPHIPPSADHNR